MQGTAPFVLRHQYSILNTCFETSVDIHDTCKVVLPKHNGTFTPGAVVLSPGGTLIQSRYETAVVLHGK